MCFFTIQAKRLDRQAEPLHAILYFDVCPREDRKSNRPAPADLGLWTFLLDFLKK